MKKIVVLGSINMDLVTRCDRAPKGGETLLGEDFSQIPGGKGANQAVTIGKLKKNVTMLGKVGNDSFGKDLLTSMKGNGVNIEYVKYGNKTTGIAKIIVEKNGQNRILVISGANSEVDKKYVDEHLDIIKNSDILVVQLEIPLETVAYALQKAKEFGKTTLLNPAPAMELNEDIIKYSDYLIPNESELELITKMPINTDEQIILAGKSLIKKGVKTVIVTLGKRGCLLLTNDIVKFYNAYSVEAVDTTAAGDSFIGGLVTLLENGNIDNSIEFATKVSALAVTKRGAQTSLPTLEEVENFRGVKNEKN